jgi:segregation and condensation protein B
MEQNELQRTLMAILFAAGEPVSVQRLAQTLERDPDEIRRETRQLMDALSFHRSGIRIVQLEDAFQMCSAAEQAEFVSRTLETRKPPKLSQSQLETLTVIAYYQPATKAYVEQIRGVDSAYSVSALLTKKLICEAGRLNVPGRPILYRTTPDFLRVFGLESLDELPEIDKTQLLSRQQLRIEVEQTTAAPADEETSGDKPEEAV